MTSRDWWKNAVVYQVYLRSYADDNGDGIGDLAGLTKRLHYIAALGVHALWITPFYRSPMVDHGYDIADPRSVDPLFGNLEEFDRLVATAHSLDLRVLLDIVPNHSSTQRQWFVEAAASGPGTAERDRYVIRPGRGPAGELPPNGWQSVFGGAAWERLPDGEWYLHSFSPEQPDLNWRNSEIQSDARETLRFWLDRGVDGFRIDVAHGLFKDPGLRDNLLPPPPTGTRFHANHEPHQWDQDEVHDVYRSWRSILDEYDRRDGRERTLVGEIWLDKPERLALYTRDGELDAAFAFGLLVAPWSAPEWRAAIEVANGIPENLNSAWVLGNHDVIRPVTRLGDGVTGLKRARAAGLVLLALPGPAFLYQGDELGLPEVTVPPESRQDPMWFRSNKIVTGRDGCRVPLPWAGVAPPYGFCPPGVSPWLPQPDDWRTLSVEAQSVDPESSLAMFRAAIQVRRSVAEFKDGDLKWRLAPEGCLAFDRVASRKVTCVVNMSPAPASIPLSGVLLLASHESVRHDGSDLRLPADAAAWISSA